MAKSQLQPGKEESGGKDPELWQQAPEQYVSNGDTLASMTGGDAGTYEGIVDYIMTGEEQSAPDEGEIIAAEQAGMLERNYPAEIDSSCNATPAAQRELIQGGDLTSLPTHNAPAAVGPTSQGGELVTGSLEGGESFGIESNALESTMAGSLTHIGQYSGGGGDQPGGMIVDHTRDDAKLFKAASGLDPATLQAENANTINELDGVTSSLIAQIDGLMAGLAGGMQGQYQGGQGTLDAVFTSSFTSVSTAFDEARSAADVGAADALSRIETSTTEAYAHIDSESERILNETSNLVSSETSRVTALANATANAALAKITAGQATVRQGTDSAVSEAGTVGARLAAEYRGRGNGGTEGKRDEARAQVAEQVAAAYQEQENLPQAGLDAIASMEAEKSNILGGIDAMVNPIIRVSYPELLEGTQQSVDEGSQAVKDDIAASEADAVDTVEVEHTRMITEMNAGEADALGQLTDVHMTATDNLDTTHTDGQAGLEAIGAQMGYHIAQKKGQLDTLLGQNPMLPGDKVREEVDMLRTELEANEAEAEAALQGHSEFVGDTMGEIVADASSTMTNITAESTAAAAQMGADATMAFDELATGFESAVDDSLTRYDTQMADLQSQVEQQCADIWQNVSSGLQSGLDSVDQGVTEFTTGFIDNLDLAVNGTGDDQMVGTIRRVAEEEAAKIKEPSFWDKVVSVVAVILVIAVIVAIAVVVPMALAALPAVAGVSLTAGTLLGSIAIGAITSLCTEIVMQFVEHGFDFGSWDGWKILRETFVGGVVGGVTFGVGSLIQNSARAGRAAITAGSSVDDLTRIQRVTMNLTTNTGSLNIFGEFVKSFSGNIVGDSLKAGLGPDEFPSIGDLILKSGSSAVTSRLNTGIKEHYGLADNDWRANGFTSFIEEVSKEVQSGSIQKAFEAIEIDPAEVGGGDFTSDYQPSWNPTW